MTEQQAKPHVVLGRESAEQVWDWFRDRGGIIVWRSMDVDGPARQWTTPMQDAVGDAPSRPHYRARPDRYITDPGDVVVVESVECERFKVAMLETETGVCCSDAGVRRIVRAVERANDDRSLGCGAWHTLDVETGEAVIYRAGDEPVGLLEYVGMERDV